MQILITLIAFNYLFTNSENTSLYNACNSGKSKIARLLLENGADVNKKNRENKSPLYIAASSTVSLVKLLIDNGAEMDTNNCFKNTLLHVAAYYGKIKIVKYLVSLKADLNARNKDEILSFVSYETPLLVALLKRNFEVVRYLINNGADISNEYKAEYHFNNEKLLFVLFFILHAKKMTLKQFVYLLRKVQILKKQIKRIYHLLSFLMQLHSTKLCVPKKLK